MALLTKAPRGTADLLPSESYKLRFIEKTLADTAALYGFQEIRTPVFEHTELFQRGVGETTDVVQKEMYTFEDNGHRSVTLRPEGTAGTVRAFLEHGLFNEPMPQKYYYLTSCYRYEKPQAGRLREFHQLGVEAFGAEGPAQDAEIIALAAHFFDIFGLEDIRLELNSIGCKTCRKDYQAALRAYFTENIDNLCETCRDRLARNPMRILDCKNPECGEIAKGAPQVLDYLCEECDAHFKSVQRYLRTMDIPFTVNPTIVRGLDYYTRTVFEFVSGAIGAQGTVCGGGRYDGLVEELGGSPTPACGFGLGIERLKLLMEAQGIAFPQPERVDIYIAPANADCAFEAMRMTEELRRFGLRALTDVSGRSVKAQMKFANKVGALFTMILGEDEIGTKRGTVKNMDNGEVKNVDLTDLPEQIANMTMDVYFGHIGDDDDFKQATLTLLDGGKK